MINSKIKVVLISIIYLLDQLVHLLGESSGRGEKEGTVGSYSKAEFRGNENED